jgi:putative membrane protein
MVERVAAPASLARPDDPARRRFMPERMSRLSGNWATTVALLAHLGALTFGLVGILIMLPNPELWNDDPRAVRVFNFSIEHAGPIHIILGAVTMALFGLATVGFRKTTIFFAISFSFSLTSELLGTGTGWPFGNYAYTDYLGWKVLGHVPYSIPLSWFYVGFACYLLARQIVDRLGLSHASFWTLAGGVWLLTVWDLVLDPAMAHESLRIQFWHWFQDGPYFGMPVKNFIGWSVTGLLYMGVSRLLWREGVEPREFGPAVPLVVYLTNMLFAMMLSASVDLWAPIGLALLLGVVPALLALRRVEPRPRRRAARPQLVWPASIQQG